MNLSLNIAASNGPHSSESINCELGLWNNEKEKTKKKKVYNCVGKTVRRARGVTLTGGAILWADGWAAERFHYDFGWIVKDLATQWEPENSNWSWASAATHAGFLPPPAKCFHVAKFHWICFRKTGRIDLRLRRKTEQREGSLVWLQDFVLLRHLGRRLHFRWPLERFCCDPDSCFRV